MRPREREKEDYLSHGICLLKQASDSKAKSHSSTKIPAHGSGFRLNTGFGLGVGFDFFFNF